MCTTAKDKNIMCNLGYNAMAGSWVKVFFFIYRKRRCTALPPEYPLRIAAKKDKKDEDRAKVLF